MQMIRMMGASLAALATAGMAMPAAAHDGRRGKQGRHHRGDKVDAGDIALGAVLLGGLLALSGSKKKRAAPIAHDAPPEPAAGVVGVPRVAIEEMTADDAADTCAIAAEGQGAKVARIAQVGEVTAVNRSGVQWLVSGTIQLRDGYRQARGRSETFRCSIGERGVPEVRIAGGEVVAAVAP